MEKATAMHKALVEAAAEHDETLMEKFFEQDSLTEDEMREGIRKGLASRGMFPVFCVCAGKDMGVRRLMEFLGNVVPFSSRIAVSVTLSAVMAAPTKSSLPGQSMIFSFLPFHSTCKTVENTE